MINYKYFGKSKFFYNSLNWGVFLICIKDKNLIWIDKTCGSSIGNLNLEQADILVNELEII